MTRAILCILAIVALFAAVPATAGTYSFVPYPSDLWELDHSYYYTWGIGWSVPEKEAITEGVLTISKINNWKYEPNANWLYMHLLDDPLLGTRRYVDNQGGGDNLSGQGVLFDIYTDNDTLNRTLTYKFSSMGLLDTLKSYASNGKFGFGFDPDCHYYNCGIKFQITTEPEPSNEEPPVPEPFSMALSALGLSAVAAIRKARGNS